MRFADLLRSRWAWACCGALVAALALGACDDTLPPIEDAGVGDDGGARDGPSGDAGRDATPPADRAVVDAGPPPRDQQLADRAVVPDGPQPADACVPPSGGCYSDGDCKAASQVCSTSLGECLPDPCCASCTVCYGKCVAKPQKLVAAITDAKAYKDLSGASPNTVYASAIVDYTNNHGAVVNNVKLTQSVLLSATSSNTYQLVLQPEAAFAGTLNPGQSLTVVYETTQAGQTIPFACQADVRVRTMITYTVSGSGGTTEQIGPVLSPLIQFGCY